MAENTEATLSVAPEEPLLTAHVWTLGDPDKQVLLAGLLADQPDLREATLTPKQWQQKLTAYAKSTRV